MGPTSNQVKVRNGYTRNSSVLQGRKQCGVVQMSINFWGLHVGRISCIFCCLYLFLWRHAGIPKAVQKPSMELKDVMEALQTGLVEQVLLDLLIASLSHCSLESDGKVGYTCLMYERVSEMFLFNDY